MMLIPEDDLVVEKPACFGGHDPLRDTNELMTTGHTKEQLSVILSEQESQEEGS